MRSALYSSCFTSNERAHGIHSRGSWVGPSLSRDRENATKNTSGYASNLVTIQATDNCFCKMNLHVTCYQNSSGMSSYIMLSNSVDQSASWEGIRSAATLPYAVLQSVFWQASADSLLVLCLSSTEGWRQERRGLRRPTRRPATLVERCLHTGRLMIKNGVSITWWCHTIGCHFTLNCRKMEHTQVWRLDCKDI